MRRQFYIDIWPRDSARSFIIAQKCEYGNSECVKYGISVKDESEEEIVVHNNGWGRKTDSILKGLTQAGGQPMKEHVKTDSYSRPAKCLDPGQKSTRAVLAVDKNVLKKRRKNASLTW
jgi:hypothetical protein